MSLDFDVSAVKDFQNVTTAPHERFGKAQWHPVTEVLVWATIPCGFNAITEKNLDEVWDRVNIWQMMNGSLLNGPKGGIHLSKRDVEMHVGLRTNATKKTRTEFMKTIERVAKERACKVSAMETIGWKGRPGNAE